MDASSGCPYFREDADALHSRSLPGDKVKVEMSPYDLTKGQNLFIDISK